MAYRNQQDGDCLISPPVLGAQVSEKAWTGQTVVGPRRTAAEETPQLSQSRTHASSTENVVYCG
ncbi:hypothetical protein INS49_015611 [Diaporthe citri]|uniref:uncharacterized protein n=1 Tax=Diaporthe citri TaxID=83186 RepID=UPI001C7FE51B|nr:uncharacterized protein INS49_015611 [Diaporthe citri]KAG6356224.1 hypothetical protein INS49_015611 [Diaporthe citri]